MRGTEIKRGGVTRKREGIRGGNIEEKVQRGKGGRGSGTKRKGLGREDRGEKV